MTKSQDILAGERTQNIPELNIAGVTLGDRGRRVITSSKRMTFINGSAVFWNKKRTEFFATAEGIPTRMMQELNGGPLSYPLTLTDAAREAILEIWRAGRIAWCEENLSPGFHRDGKNGGYRLVQDSTK